RQHHRRHRAGTTPNDHGEKPGGERRKRRAYLNSNAGTKTQPKFKSERVGPAFNPAPVTPSRPSQTDSSAPLYTAHKSYNQQAICTQNPNLFFYSSAGGRTG